MKKYIVLILPLFFLVTIISLLLANCASEDGASNNNGSNNGSAEGEGSNSFGFTITPGAPTADTSYSSDPSDYGFDVDLNRVIRGSSSSSSYSSGGERDSRPRDPFYKSNFVLEAEDRYGTSASLTITDQSAFEDFRLSEPVNSMSDIEDLRVYVKLNKASTGNYYAGQVSIIYEDHGREPPVRTVEFKSDSGENAQYNVWFKKSGKDYFHGFFENAYGSIVLVVDAVTPVVTSSDNPQTATLYSGSIWIMMFRTTFKPGANSCNNHDQQYVFEYNKRPGLEQLQRPLKKCWFVTSGPYDCRTWRSGNAVNTSRAVYPDDSCYKKMGTFQGLDILKAFGVSQKGDIVVNQ